MITSQITIPKYAAQYTKTFDGKFVNAKLEYGKSVQDLFKRLGSREINVGEKEWKKVKHRLSMKNIVPKYQFEYDNIKTSNLNKFNGQSNSLYFRCEKYFGFYSKKQKDLCQSIHWREFNLENHKWQNSLQIYIKKAKKSEEDRCSLKEHMRNIMQKRPFFDEEKMVFRNRWGKVVEITDVFPISVYDRLDVLMNAFKKEWDDVEFVGVVIKFDRFGNQIKM